MQLTKDKERLVKSKEDAHPQWGSNNTIPAKKRARFGSLSLCNISQTP